jgi:hypothetical protein
MALTRQDMIGILFVIVLFGGIIALSVFFYMGSTLVFFLIFLGLIVLFVVLFVVRPSKHFELNKHLSWIFGNAAPIVATIGVAITLLTPLGSTVMKRLVISGIAVVACWLILLPNFLRREFGRLIHPSLDTGLNPPWTDIIYGFIGVVMFIGALVMQHYLVDNAAPE